MADGLFDDLIPKQPAPAPSGGLFDDLVPDARLAPRPAVPNAFADVRSGIDSTETLGSSVNVGDVTPVLPGELIVPEGVAPGLGESLYRRAQAGLGSQVGGALRFLGESLAPDVGTVSPNVQAVLNAVLPQRTVGQQTATLGADVTDFAGQLREEAQSGQRPEGFIDALTNPVDTLRYYGGIAAESLPGTLTALATRNPQAATALIAGTTGGQTYGEQRSQGVSQAQALQQATQQALIEGAGSRGAFEEAFTPGSLLARLPRVALPEVLGESGTEVLQTITERPDTPLGELLATALDAAIASAPGAVVETLGGATARPPAPTQAPAPAPEPLGGPIPEAAPPAVGINQESRQARIINRAEPSPEPIPAATPAADPLADLDALLAALSPDTLAQAADVLGGTPSPAVSPPPAAPPTADLPRGGEAAATLTRAPDDYVPPVAPEGVAPQIDEEFGTDTPPTDGKRVWRDSGRKNKQGRPIFEPTIDYSRDGLLEYLAAAGGLNFEDIRREGGADPALLKDRRTANPLGGIGFPALRRTGGLSLDRLRESMIDDGWFPADDPNAPPTVSNADVVDRVMDAINGRPVFHPIEGQERRAMRDAGRREAEGAFEDFVATQQADAAAQADAVRSLREANIAIDEADAAEAASLVELASRARDAGIDEIDVAPFANEPAADYARRLWNLTGDRINAPDRRAAPQDRGERVPQALALEGQRAEATERPQARAAAQVGLFGAPSARETVDAEARRRAAERSGATGTGRTDIQAGGGELFAGPRPQQARIDDEALSREEPQELAESDLTDAERAAFARQSVGREAQLRAAVEQALGPVAGKVKYLPNPTQLPDRLRQGVESRLRQRGGSGQTTALFDPKTGDVYLFTEANPSPERAVFNVAHEIAGHQGLRALLGDALNSALDIALQNPTVAAVSEAIALERNIDASTDAGQRLAAEEALAELAAAVRTGNYDVIADRYGVTVPPGIRERVKAAIDNFLRRLKALLQKATGQEFTDADVRALLEAAWQAAEGGPTLADTRAPGGAVEATAPEQTQTAAFRRWFGDSKVVDANGAPLVVYHGTAGQIDAFDDAMRGTTTGAKSAQAGHWFTSSPDVAASYADYAAVDAPIRRKIKENDALERKAQRSGRDEDWGAHAEHTDELERMVAEFEGGAARGQSSVPVYLAIQNPVEIDADGAQFEDFQQQIGTAIRQAQAQRGGVSYDGVIVRNLVDDPQGIKPPSDHFLAFDPTQIKSATANRGTFDPASPSILENVEQMTPAQVETQAAKLPADATGRSIVAGGQLVPFLAAAKQAGADLAGVRAALQQTEPQARARSLVAAIDALLPLESQPEATPQPAPAPKAAPEPKRPSTGTKNEVVRAEREAAGKDPILAAARQSNESTLAQAEEVLQREPERGQELVERLAREGVAGVSAVDEAVLLIHKATLRQARDRAAERAASPQLSDDARAVAERQWRELEAQLNEVDQATFAAGREWGRMGQFRQRMLRDDFTLAALERKERAREGRPLTRAESAQLKTFAGRIAELQAKADLLQTRLHNAESEGAYEALIKELSRAPKRRPTLDRLRAAANESRAFLSTLESVPRRKNQSGATLDPRAVYHLTRIGAFHVANGAATFSDWLGRMKADVGDWLDNVRAQLPAVFQASKAQNEPRGDGPSVAEVRGTIDPEKVTPKDVRKLAEAHIREGVRGEPAVMQAVADALGLDLTTARRLLIQTERRAPTRSEAQQELADLKAVVRLQSEIDRLEAGEAKASPSERPQRSEQVQAKRDELTALRQKLREAARPDPEQRYQELRGKDIAKRIAELQDRIARSDFDKPVRTPRALSEANQRAQFELDKAKEEFLRHQFEAELAKRSPLRKIFGGAVDTANFSRALMTSLDLSGLLRQGGFISYGHPVKALQALGPSLKAFASEQAEHAVRKEIESRPNFPLYKKAGLEFTGIGTGPLNKVEEAYASRWVDRFPKALGGGLIRGSGRSYTTLLNRLRADSFDAMAASLSRTATPTPEEAKAIANYVNVATGRGKVGTSENAGQALNTLFFAPRLVASRFQLLAGQPLYGGSNRTRKLIAQEYARFLMGYGVVTALAAFGLGADEDEQGKLIEWDPRSSNFGKLHVGNTWLDPLAGLAQVTTLVSRLATGETKTSKGAIKPLRAEYTLTDLRRALGEDIEPHKLAKDGSLPFGSGSATDVIGRFLRTKLAPVPGAALNTLSGENVIGEEVTPADTAASLVTPMSFSDVGAIMEEQGVPKGAAITLLGLLGVGVQHREQKIDQEALAVNAEIAAKDELAKLPQDQWAEAFAEKKRQYPVALAGVELAEKSDGTYKTGKTGRPSFKTDKDAHEAAISKAKAAAEE